jgi:hypothetical protein
LIFKAQKQIIKIVSIFYKIIFIRKLVNKKIFDIFSPVLV